MTRKQQRRKLNQRQHHNTQESALDRTLREVKERAKKQRKGAGWIETQMIKAGYLADGRGGFRNMSERERSLWVG